MRSVINVETLECFASLTNVAKAYNVTPCSVCQSIKRGFRVKGNLFEYLSTYNKWSDAQKEAYKNNVYPCGIRNLKASTHAFNMAAEKEQLRTLLRECREMLLAEKNFLVQCTRLEDINNITAKIDEALND